MTELIKSWLQLVFLVYLLGLVCCTGVLLLLSSQLLPLAASSGQSKVIQMRDSYVLHQYLCGTYVQKVANNTVLKLILPLVCTQYLWTVLIVSNKLSVNIGIVSNMEEPSVISCTMLMSGNWDLSMSVYSTSQMSRYRAVVQQYFH